jgi:hypothetical protein
MFAVYREPRELVAAGGVLITAPSAASGGASPTGRIAVGTTPVEFPRRHTDAGSEEFAAQSVEGTADKFCHVLLDGPPFRYTLCGQRCHPPVRNWHGIGNCVSGFAVCPKCKDIGGR